MSAVWMHIGKEYTFEAAHQLWEPTWDKERNSEVFGQCSRLHGHSYKLEVQVGGLVDTVRGWVMDYADLSDIVNGFVVFRWDHQFLNDLDPFNQVKATAENIALEAFRIINAALLHEPDTKGIILERVLIRETAKSFAEVVR